MPQLHTCCALDMPYSLPLFHESTPPHHPGQAMAVIERIRRALAGVSDHVSNTLGPISQAYGESFGCDTWAVQVGCTRGRVSWELDACCRLPVCSNPLNTCTDSHAISLAQTKRCKLIQPVRPRISLARPKRCKLNHPSRPLGPRTPPARPPTHPHIHTHTPHHPLFARTAVPGGGGARRPRLCCLPGAVGGGAAHAGGRRAGRLAGHLAR